MGIKGAQGLEMTEESSRDSPVGGGVHIYTDSNFKWISKGITEWEIENLK